MGLGPVELIAILAIALLIFGPKKLPEIGRTIGTAVREFKQGIQEITEDVGIADIKKDIDSSVKEIKEDVGGVQQNVKETLDLGTKSASKDAPATGAVLKDTPRNPTPQPAKQSPNAPPKGQVKKAAKPASKRK